MVNPENQTSEYIDVLELLEILVKDKWRVLAIMAVFFIAGLSYVQFTSIVYQVRVPFRIELNSVAALQLCGRDYGCLSREAGKEILRFSGPPWTIDNGALILTTASPESHKNYESQLARTEKALTEATLKSAKAEQMIIEEQLDKALLGTERAATNMLNAKRIILDIEQNNIPAIQFSVVSIDKIKPRTLFILAGAIVLGFFIGAAYVFLRAAVARRQR